MWGKYFKTAHCMVSLYRSVSRKEMTPSGKGDEPWNSMMVRGGEPGLPEVCTVVDRLVQYMYVQYCST